MDIELASLSWNGRKSEKVLERARGGGRAGKQISLSLVLALALLLIAVGALALTLINPFAERVMEMEHENGSFSEWTLDEKLSLVAAMEEFGVDTTAIPNVASMPESEADAVLGSAIETLYAGEVGSLHYNILEKAKGFFDAWTLEDKAWYGELLLKYGHIARPNDCLYSLPGADVMPMEDAYALACRWLTEKYGIDCEELTRYGVFPFYLSFYAAPDTYYWKFHWRNEYNEMMYSALIPVDGNENASEIWRRPTGEEWDAVMADTTAQALAKQALREKLEAERGLMITWSLEEKAELYETYGLPREGEITQEQAVALAKEAIVKERGVPKETFDALYAYSYFLADDEGKRYYAVSFFEDEEANRLTPYAASVDAETGDILGLYGDNGNG